MCLGTGGQRRGRTQRRARECVRMASVAKGQEDISIPADPGSCSQAMAGSSSSWVEAAVCGSAAFGGLTVWLTFKSKTAHKEKGFFCARWWGRRNQGEWWATAEVGPYLQPPQKSSELCSLSLSLSLFGKWYFSPVAVCLSCSVWEGCCTQLSNPWRLYYCVRQAMEQKEQCWQEWQWTVMCGSLTSFNLHSITV